MIVTDLRCEDLNKSFDGTQALRGVSVTFEPGAITAVIGPNGAGKSTLIDVCSGMLRPDSGKCCWGALELTALQPHEVVRAGVVRSFQEVRLVYLVSVMENVLFSLQRNINEGFLRTLFRWSGSRAQCEIRKGAEVLESVGLWDMRDVRAGELSYGEQKLLAMACCIALEPSVLLLDEPMSGLHREKVDQVARVLSRLRGQAKTIVLVEHSMEVVRSFADRTVLMDRGKIRAVGSTDEILAHPKLNEAYLG